MKNPQKRRKKWCVSPEKVVRKPWVSAGLVAQAATLARRHALRGYDAVQLAAALEIHATDPSLTLLSADAELNTAATAEGLAVEDPNSHP